VKDAAKSRFKAYLLTYWHATLPEADLELGRPGLLNADNWQIRYCFGQKEGRDYMDVYGSHRMTNDRHLRLYEDGEMEDLEALRMSYGWDPKIPGDEERSKREHIEYNTRIWGMLDAKFSPEGESSQGG
jgi:hypothetical protein